MNKQKKKAMNENDVKIIKISKETLFEFIYEKFIEDQEQFFDIKALDVMNIFDIERND